MLPYNITDPAAYPPPGVLPNFVDPPNRSNLGITATISCTVTCIICCLIRAYSRIYCDRKITAEDGLGLAAFGFYAGFVWCGFSIWKAVGFFVHQWNVRMAAFFDVTYIFYIFPLLYFLTMMCTKTAILLEWIRIFRPAHTRNPFFWISWAMITVNIMFYTICIILAQFYCTPVEKNWHRWVPGTCSDRRAIDVVPAIFNFVFDIIILVLPQRVIWSLQMRTCQKIGVSFVFSVGILACIFAAARIQASGNINYDSDLTYDIGKVYLWILAESTCTMVVFCVPAFPKAFGSTESLENMIESFKLRTNSYFKSLKRSTPLFSNGRNERVVSVYAPETMAAPSKRTYQRIVENGLNRRISLLELQDPAPQTAVILNNRHSCYRHDPVILRTTEFTMGEISASEDTRRIRLEQQAPWESNRQQP